MNRRHLLGLLGAATVGSARLAIGQTRVPHLVYLWLGPTGSDGSTREGLQTGLRELGYHEGQDIVVQYRYADGKEERLAELAAAAVAEQPDVIVTPGTVVTRAVKRLTRTIPIVSASGDPVGSGFIAGLARPGGNITGLAIVVGPELAEKWLELIVEIVPQARRIAMLINAANPVGRTQLVRMRAVADRLGSNFTFDEYPIREAADFPSAFEAIQRAKADALVVDNDPLMSSKRAAIGAFATEHRIPAISGVRDFVEAGLLIAYGASIFDIFRRTATYVDKILKGAKPADLPVEQPTKFELVVNLNTAKALGLTVPPSILARADEVIE
jgi:putative ABC transport system substrate-binding protein